MFLHELSRKICRDWGVRVDGESYGALVRHRFGNRCPYCLRDLLETTAVVEHLDGMNRYRVGLHIPGNVLVSCKRCNSEKRRDDSLKVLTLADSGWASFLSHNSRNCDSKCATCRYWSTIWPDQTERDEHLAANLRAIADFRKEFELFDATTAPLLKTLPEILTKLYSDCQAFAETEIASMLARF